jgi:hypothetical protein
MVAPPGIVDAGEKADPQDGNADGSGAAVVPHHQRERSYVMKRMRLVWICSAVLALALTATASWAQAPGDQDIPGVAIAGVSQEFAPVWGGPFSGSGTVAINGISYPIAVTSNALALSDLPDNFGRFVGTTEHVLDFGDGNMLMTTDEVLLTPTQPGWFLVQATMTIAGGRGMFAGAAGQIDVYGQMQSDGTSAATMWLMEGRVFV